MDQIFIEEKENLSKVEKIILEEINKNLATENNLKYDSTKLSFEDRLRGTHLHLNSLLYNVGETIYKLNKAIDSPYFGRIDYKEDSETEKSKIYIGRTSIVQNGKPIVYDWRSPICGLYYDSELGKVSYQSPTGVQNGELSLKRHIMIKDAELINAVDSSLVSNDDMLLPYLNENTDKGMKTIIASIQKEQNTIIRGKDDNIIVQGVAGSGKTSVALHRIAYLIYSQGEKAQSDNFMILGPNKYFLNYISSVLPDLDTTPVRQMTLVDLMNDYLDTDMKLLDNVDKTNLKDFEMQQNISMFKGSIEFKTLLDSFMQKCLKGDAIVSEDFKIGGKTVFSKEDILDRLVDTDGKHLSFDKTHKYFKNLFKDKKNEIYTKLNKEYEKVYTALPFGDPIRNEYVNKSNELSKMIRVQGEKMLDKYFKSLNKSCIQLYVKFISTIDEANTCLSKEEILKLQKDTLKAIKIKQVLFEDISPLMHLNYLLSNKRYNCTNVIIDEAQDYSEFTYMTLKTVFDKAKFNIYGDVAQGINSYRGISSWNVVKNTVFNEECHYYELNKSYRTTMEITNVANNILESLDLNNAYPVIRHGNSVDFICTNNIGSVLSKIEEWVEQKYRTIAIICKNDNEAEKVSDDLLKFGLNAQHLHSNSGEYGDGIFTLTVETAKGLEFDCTIISDASSKHYDSHSDIDMHLLYVALTRALHEEVVLYDGEIVEPLRKELNKSRTR